MLMSGISSFRVAFCTMIFFLFFYFCRLRDDIIITKSNNSRRTGLIVYHYWFFFFFYYSILETTIYCTNGNNVITYYGALGQNEKTRADNYQRAHCLWYIRAHKYITCSIPTIMQISKCTHIVLLCVYFL